MRQPLTEIARAALVVVQNRSRRNGLDLFEELNKVGLIATEPRKREIVVSAFKNMQDRMSMTSADDYLRQAEWHRNNSNAASPSDLLRAVELWVSEYIQRIEND